MIDVAGVASLLGIVGDLAARPPRHADRREVLFLSQIVAQRALSWVGFGRGEGSFFAAHRLGDGRLEMLEINPEAAEARSDTYRLFSMATEFETRGFERNEYDPRVQPWYVAASADETPAWFFIENHPDGRHGAIALCRAGRCLYAAPGGARSGDRAAPPLPLPRRAHGRQRRRRVHLRVGRQHRRGAGPARRRGHAPRSRGYGPTRR